MYCLHISEANYSETVDLILFQGVTAFLLQGKSTLGCHIVLRKCQKCLQKASPKKESYVNTSVVVFRGCLTHVYRTQTNGYEKKKEAMAWQKGVFLMDDFCSEQTVVLYN